MIELLPLTIESTSSVHTLWPCLGPGYIGRPPGYIRMIFFTTLNMSFSIILLSGYIIGYNKNFVNNFLDLYAMAARCLQFGRLLR